MPSIEAEASIECALEVNDSLGRRTNLFNARELLDTCYGRQQSGIIIEVKNRWPHRPILTSDQGVNDCVKVLNIFDETEVRTRDGSIWIFAAVDPENREIVGLHASKHRELVVVRDEAVKQKLVRAALGQSFIAEAPVVVVVCVNVPRTAGRYGRRGEELYCIQDTAAATQNIHLAAYALGYATCWVGAFDEDEAAKIIKAPVGVRPVAIVPIGKPAEKPSPPQRMPLSKIVREESF